MMSKDFFNRLAPFLKPYRHMFILSLVFSVLYVIFTILIPVMIGSAIDAAFSVNNVDFQHIFYCIIGITILSLLAGISQWIMNVYTRKLSSNVSKDMCEKAFDTINKAPLSYIDTTPHGDLISIIVNDAAFVSEGIMQALSQLLPGVATILGTLIIMMILNPVIAIVVVLVTPVSIWFASFMAKKTAKYFKRQSEAQGALSAFVNETVPAHSLVHSFGYEEHCFKKLEKMTDELYTSGILGTFFSSIINPGTRFVNAIVYAAVGVIGAVITVMGAMSVGQLTSFLTYANQYTKPFNEVSGVLTQVQSAVAGFWRIIAISDTKTVAQDSEDSIVLQNCNGKVELNNVCFSYTKDKKFMENLNIMATSGSKTAIVGPTGCGKTTLINLLMRFYETTGGEILVDGTNIKNIKRNALRNMYGMVLQETWLKNATVRDNIAYGKQNATHEEVVKAAKAAHAHSFIKRLENGYDTVIKPGGGNLSAGQKQLLCIARIMLCQPDMLILDEATSSIDTRTEMLVQSAFDALMKDRTSFVVAHRLSTIQNADNIIVMKDGNIIEQGTHEELLRKKGFYEELYESQFDKSSAS